MVFVEKCKDFVFEIFKTNYEQGFLLHNYAYTVKAVDALTSLLKEEKVKDKEVAENMQIAMWLHATGYFKDLEVGATTSISFANKFLNQEGVEASRALVIVSFVKATNLATVPTNHEEKILQDAAYHFFTEKRFDEILTLWKEEYAQLLNVEEDEWRVHVKKVMNTKFYLTNFAATNWQFKANSNYLKVAVTTTEPEKSAKEIKAIIKQNEKGKDTVFRITLRNHISLSDNADRKAHILLSVNSIVISLIFSRIFPKLDNPSNSFLYVPTLVFMIFTVISIILSVIATRPRITTGRFTKEQLKNRNINILFFGNFYRMKLKDYEEAMDEVLADNDFIYNSLTKDLYYLGKVVAKKYRILQYTYTVFMIGIVISTLMYIIFFNIYN